MNDSNLLDWPAAMRAATLARYLDIDSTATVCRQNGCGG